MERTYHAYPEEQNEIISWAHSILKRDDVVILDTETTGIEATDEVIEVGVVDLKGNKVFFSRLNPKKRRIANDAKRAHNISISDLSGEPRYEEAHPGLLNALQGKLVLTYNAKFDVAMLEQTYSKHMGASCSFEEAYDAKLECLMEAYARFCGMWSTELNKYRWPKLPGSTHSVIGDCRAALILLRTIAQTPLADEEIKRQKDAWMKPNNAIDFVAVSTESSTLDTGDICSLGIAVVKDGEIVETRKWLFCPPRMRFSEQSIRKFKKIGIEKDEFANKPTFEQCWPLIRKYFDGMLLLSYQDFPAQLQLLSQEHDIEYGELNFVDFKKVMKRAFPRKRSYGLTKLAEELGYELTFHDNESDSEVTAQLILEALTEAGAADIASLMPNFSQ